MLGAVAAVALDDGIVGLMAITAAALVVIQVLGTLEFVERLLDERSRWAATDALTGPSTAGNSTPTCPCSRPVHSAPATASR